MSINACAWEIREPLEESNKIFDIFLSLLDPHQSKDLFIDSRCSVIPFTGINAQWSLWNICRFWIFSHELTHTTFVLTLTVKESMRRQNEDKL